MSEKIPYEDIIIPNLVDPSISTLNRLMAQYLVDKVYQGKNVLITGSSKAGRTLLLNVLSKSIDMKKHLMVMEMKPELLLLEHQCYSINLENVTLDKRSQDYFLITKGFPHYEEYQSFILDDVPRSSYANIYRLLMSNKQVLGIFNEDNPQSFLHQMLHGLTQNLHGDIKSKVGIGLMEKVDIIVHIRKYEDDYIRIKEICEPQGYDPNTNSIILEKIFEFITNGQLDHNGKLIGDFVRY